MKKIIEFFDSNKFVVISAFIVVSYYFLAFSNKNNGNEKFHIPKTLKVNGEFIEIDFIQRPIIKILNPIKKDTIRLLFDPIAGNLLKKNWMELNKGESIWFDLWEHDSEVYNRESRIKTQFSAYSFYSKENSVFTIDDYSNIVKSRVDVIDPKQKLNDLLFVIVLIIAIDFIGKNRELIFANFEKVSDMADIFFDPTKKYAKEVQEYFAWLKIDGFQGRFRLTSDYSKPYNDISNKTEYTISQNKLGKWLFILFGLMLILSFILFLINKNFQGAIYLIPQILTVLGLAIFRINGKEIKLIINQSGIIIPNEKKLNWNEIEFTIIHENIREKELLIKTINKKQPKIIRLNGLNKSVRKISQIIEVHKSAS
ncbi:hypothetical protein SAMN00777080_3938 [Aquiflexum balticum DSM 16537]|uniref:Uncharacterized protein n=1 Tax=Aquiflexum balticum DSM 16537 TaxID=758820 RepID=A0A1W2H8U5_9BACT|nr:hypothetical protein [Aquiflexum balticum]SMD45290.1 hypothetical protein SAMN00777080_3938 [Aquiflexum balticum DSM 16537]